jgi:N-acetyl-anhydromuramyl-L-alanine amidase AmpD
MPLINRYPSARIVAAHPTNYHACEPKRGGFSLIVIHITSGHADPNGPAEMFATPSDQRQPAVKSSANFVVGQLDEAVEPVIQCVDLGDIAYHASQVNVISVGIEHCAREPMEFSKTDAGLAITDAQYTKSARLAAWLARLAGLSIDRNHFKGHCEASPRDGHDKCPIGVAGGWDWDRYLALVQQAFDAGLV